MKTKMKMAIGLLGAVLLAAPAIAQERGTKEDAVTLVTKAVEQIKAGRAEDLFKAINAKDQGYAIKDVYVYIMDMKATVTAHWANQKLVGTDAMENTDVSGKEYVKSRLEKAKSGQPFTDEYRWPNPSTKKIEVKEAYCEVSGSYMACAGYFK